MRQPEPDCRLNRTRRANSNPQGVRFTGFAARVPCFGPEPTMLCGLVTGFRPKTPMSSRPVSGLDLKPHLPSGCLSRFSPGPPLPYDPWRWASGGAAHITATQRSEAPQHDQASRSNAQQTCGLTPLTETWYLSRNALAPKWPIIEVSGEICLHRVPFNGPGLPCHDSYPVCC